MHRDSYQPRPSGMTELTVRTPRSSLAPAIRLQRANDLASFHMYKVYISESIRKIRGTYIRNTPLPVVWVSNSL